MNTISKNKLNRYKVTLDAVARDYNENHDPSTMHVIDSMKNKESGEIEEFESHPYVKAYNPKRKR